MKTRLGLFAIVLSFLLIGARWILVYRHGQPLDIDEAGYLSIALDDYQALVRSGVTAWWNAVEAPSNQAPLTSALASLLFAATGPHLVAAFAVPLLAAAGTILATYALGKATGSREIGIVACILVASVPVVIHFSRSFHFAVPATLATTLTLLALLRSDRFARSDWSIAFGLCLGLMPLARTMTIAFIPGIVLGALLHTVAEPRDRRRRVLMFAAALAVAVLTAAVWLVPNGRYVASYLFNFGYGTRSVEFGPERSGFGALITTLSEMCDRDFHVPHFIVAVAGSVGMLIFSAAVILADGVSAFVRRALRSQLLPIVVTVIAALAALTSTRNIGSGFFAPIAPAMLTLAAWVFFRVGGIAWRAPVVSISLLALVALGATVPLIDLRQTISRPRSVVVPILGEVTVIDGRGPVQQYAANGGFGEAGATEAIDVAAGRAWVALNRETAAIITRRYGFDAVIAFGFRHVYYNMNTVNLEQLLAAASRFWALQAEPALRGDTVSGYTAWLNQEAKNTCALITSERGGHEFMPPIDRTRMREAAEQSGFRPVQQWPAPDGQMITLWDRSLLLSHCRPEPPLERFPEPPTISCVGNGSIDTVNGLWAKDVPAQIHVRLYPRLTIAGWLAASVADGSLPAKTFVVLTGPFGDRLYARAQLSARPDIAAWFHHPSLANAGFGVSLDVRDLKGSYVVGLARQDDGQLQRCVDLETSITFAGRP